MPRLKKSAGPAAKSANAASAAALNIQIASTELEPGYFDVRLEVTGAAPEPQDIEVAIERLTWIPREFIESMGGEAPYDRFETRWPLGPEDPRSVHLTLQTAADEARESSGADLLPFALPVSTLCLDTDITGQKSSRLLEGAEHTAITTFRPAPGGVACDVGTSTFRFVTQQFIFLRKPSAQEESGIIFETCTMEE
ncbi:hypothetical protein EON80_22125, partial [bacterium]